MAKKPAKPRVWVLAAELRSARKASGIGVNELARMMEVSSGQISLWESGDRVPNVERAVEFLTAVRCSAGEKERILEIARHVGDPNWLAVGVHGIPEQLAGVVECERLASVITEWSPAIVPGQLQVPEYTRAITQAREFAAHDIELRGFVGAGRQQYLTTTESVKFVALIGEQGLRDPVGAPTVMRRQLQHLLDMANRPNMEVRVVSQGNGWHPGRLGQFVLYEFPGTLSVVYFEHLSSGAFIPTPHDVAEYHKAVDWLLKISKGPAESAAFISSVIEEMKECSS